MFLKELSTSMNKQFIDIKLKSINFEQSLLSKNNWIVLLHKNRIPPHVGLIINGNYNSLTIKGQELNINFNVLLKTIQQKKIEASFIQLIKHPVFSINYQLEILHYWITNYKSVSPNNATCLTPIKSFLNEFYGLEIIKNELLFELIIKLKNYNFIEHFMELPSNNLTNTLQLPCYTFEALQNIITNEVALIKNK